jgi:NAD(P)-dependent dehydrogenase (short-subunit alcohol dehydrogenase family)
MISDFKGKTAVLTGGASGFGLECARIGASLGMNVVLVDVQKDALKLHTMKSKPWVCMSWPSGWMCPTLTRCKSLATAVFERFGAPHFVFNNAGVGAGGLVWENSVKDWEWLLGVNLWGVIHGVRLFTPMMLEAAKTRPRIPRPYRQHRQHGGLLTPPNMGIYNVTKHAVVALTETLYQDLKLVSEQISASVLCPYFVPTGINQSERNRPAHLPPSCFHQKPTHWPSHERQSGGQRQSQCRASGADGV